MGRQGVAASYHKNEASLNPRKAQVPARFPSQKKLGVCFHQQTFRGTDPQRAKLMKTLKSSDTDSVRAYLREIGRVPLLTHEQEILYGKQVQRSIALNQEKNIVAQE